MGDVTIPYAMIDSGSDSSIVSENIAKHLGLKIDRKKIYRLNGITSKSHSLETRDAGRNLLDNSRNYIKIIIIGTMKRRKPKLPKLY